MSHALMQQTLQHSTHCFGKGLHSGQPVSLSLHPAPEDTGIVFVRSDIKGNHNEVKARYDFVTATMLGTTISNGSVEIHTIEHLMAALWGCDVDNAYVEINNKELPIMDGSSEPFVFMIECAGVLPQAKARRVIEVLKPIEVEKDHARITLSPATHFGVELEIRFANTLIAQQSGQFDATRSSFKMDLSRARTFCLAEEVDALRTMGLARGGSLENAVVIQGDKTLNADGFRYQDECVRHKLLDCIGDIYLGGHIKGHIQGYCSGHTTNNLLLRTLFADQTAWQEA
jgi:UDP-3-O-[3-hydroxymyristoyl] N-acetylglucosamine deacetylase